jgi:hypothetical protein
MKEVNIGKQDFLWKWYCKKYQIRGEQVPAPKNLCPYFWTAVFGLALFVRHEMKLWYLWMPTVVAGGVAFTSLRQENEVVVVVGMIALSIFMFFANAAILISCFRGYDFVNRKVPWLLPSITLCFGVYLFGYSLWQGTLSTHLTEAFRRALSVSGMFLGAVLVLAVVALSIVWIASFVPHPYMLRLKKLRQDITTFSVAGKNSVCPPVNPPIDFKET